MKRKIVLVLASIFLLAISFATPLTASAVGVGDPNDGYWQAAFVVPYDSSWTYTSSWQRTFVDPNNSSNYIHYGFRKTLFSKKDYVVSYHSTEFHCGKFFSGSTWYTSNDANPGHEADEISATHNNKFCGQGCYIWINY